jgi:hypothetical protein
VADEVHIHFPWGSLLRAVATGDEVVLRDLRRLCAPGALVEIVIGLDPERDRSEIEALGLTPLKSSSTVGAGQPTGPTSERRGPGDFRAMRNER